MLAYPGSQAFFPGPDSLLAMAHYTHNCLFTKALGFSLFIDFASETATMAESSWIQSISDYEDEPLLANHAFFDGTKPRQPLRPHYQEQQFYTMYNSDWRGKSEYDMAMQDPSATDYDHELGATSWANNQLRDPTQSSLPAAAYSELCTLPQDAYAQYQTLNPAMTLDMEPITVSSNWLREGSIPNGILSADRLDHLEAVPYFASECGLPNIKYEPQPLENQTESLYSGAIGSFAPPQDLFQPVPMETSLASTPSFAELSSAASLAEVFDVSDAYAASPINSSCSEASDSAESSPSERGIAQEALSPPSLYMKQELATSTSESGPVATGAPFRRIQDMDPASRAELDRLLVAFRASGTPYKVIMDRLSHLYLGNHNTLRGRLRTLTLSPKMRVRNPVWEEHHIKLLKEAVAHESCQHPSTHKISWARVSEYIHDKTGHNSYKFSVTACSRKWQELVGEEEEEGEEEEGDDDEEES